MCETRCQPITAVSIVAGMQNVIDQARIVEPEWSKSICIYSLFIMPVP